MKYFLLLPFLVFSEGNMKDMMMKKKEDWKNEREGMKEDRKVELEK